MESSGEGSRSCMLWDIRGNALSPLSHWHLGQPSLVPVTSSARGKLASSECIPDVSFGAVQRMTWNCEDWTSQRKALAILQATFSYDSRILCTLLKESVCLPVRIHICSSWMNNYSKNLQWVTLEFLLESQTKLPQPKATFITPGPPGQVILR